MKCLPLSACSNITLTNNYTILFFIVLDLSDPLKPSFSSQESLWEKRTKIIPSWRLHDFQATCNDTVVALWLDITPYGGQRSKV